MQPKPPYLDEQDRPTPYIVWEWKSDRRGSLRSYRAVRRGRASDNFVIEQRMMDGQDAMNNPVWECITIDQGNNDGAEAGEEAFNDLLAATRAFMWHLRQCNAEAEHGTKKPEPQASS